jgi:hypothetical protein
MPIYRWSLSAYAIALPQSLFQFTLLGVELAHVGVPNKQHEDDQHSDNTKDVYSPPRM